MDIDEPGVRCSHLLLSTTACCLLHRTHNTATAIDRYLLPKGTQQQTRCMLPLLSIRGTDRTQRNRCSTITVLGQLSFASIRGLLNTSFGWDKNRNVTSVVW